ncbi:MAG: hypothetical protein ACK5P7_06165 [Bdellovibrio sp.]|jgi:hypothetical protein
MQKSESTNSNQTVSTNVGIKGVILSATSRENLCERFGCSWTRLIEFLETEELLSDKDVSLKLLQLQRERIH